MHSDRSRLSSLKQDSFASCVVCALSPPYGNGTFFDLNKNALLDNRGHIDIKTKTVVELKRYLLYKVTHLNNIKIGNGTYSLRENSIVWLLGILSAIIPLTQRHGGRRLFDRA